MSPHNPTAHALLNKTRTAVTFHLLRLGGFARDGSDSKDWKAVRKTDLETTLRKQAEQVAAKRLSQAAHTMGLENQSLSEQENRKVFAETVEKLIGNPAGLWNTI